MATLSAPLGSRITPLSRIVLTPCPTILERILVLSNGLGNEGHGWQRRPQPLVYEPT
jgi:hypothetical protein